MDHPSFQVNNIEFNPLYEKMRERFCKNGTIAEQLLARAAEYKKTAPKRVSHEEHMKTANSLPKAAAKKSKRGFFSLHKASSACMLLLIAGTVLFSGAAIGTIRNEQKEIAVLKNTAASGEDNMVLFDAIPWESEGCLEELAFSV